MERKRNGYICPLGKLFQLLTGPAVDNSVAAKDDRLFTSIYQFHGCTHTIPVRCRRVIKSRKIRFVSVGVETICAVCLLVLYVLRDVDENRPTAAGCGHIHGFMNCHFDILCSQRHICLLGNRHHHTDHIAFLKCIRGDDPAGNLAGNGKDRDRIHDRVGNSGDQIHGAGTRCRHADPNMGVGGGNRCARHSLGHENSALFMPGHDEDKFFLFFHFVENGHNGPAGITENVLNPFIDQGFEDKFRAFHFFMPSFLLWVLVQNLFAEFE